MLFLKEFCVFSQTLQQQNRDNFFQVSMVIRFRNIVGIVLMQRQGGKGETPVLRSTGGVQAEYVKYGRVLEYRSPTFFPLCKDL